MTKPIATGPSPTNVPTMPFVPEIDQTCGTNPDGTCVLNTVINTMRSDPGLLYGHRWLWLGVGAAALTAGFFAGRATKD